MTSRGRTDARRPPASTFMGPIQTVGEPDRGDTVLPAAELIIWKARYFEMWPRDMRNFTSRAVNSLSQRAKLASAASSKAARSACCRA